jgi:DNA-binding MarR family transcriptional regulator
MGITRRGKQVVRNLIIRPHPLPVADCSKGFVTLALPRRPPSLERYECARRLMARVPGADPVAIDTCLALWRFSEEMSASFEAFYVAHRLSSARGHVLAQLLAEERGLTPAQLAERAGTTPPSMTGVLRSLEREGLVRRRAMSDDRRSQSVFLTAAGRRRVEALLPLMARRLADLAGTLQPEERTAMLSGSRRLWERARALSALLPEPESERRRPRARNGQRRRARA